MNPQLKPETHVLIMNRFEITITSISNFSGVPNYGFTCAIKKLNKYTRFTCGWILCEMLDWMIANDQAIILTDIID